jgi:hypothetical protein
MYFLGQVRSTCIHVCVLPVHVLHTYAYIKIWLCMVFVMYNVHVYRICSETNSNVFNNSSKYSNQNK